MRAYRPSLIGNEDDEDSADDLEREFRAEKLPTYTERAQAGLPLFDEAGQPGEMCAENSLKCTGRQPPWRW